MTVDNLRHIVRLHHHAIYLMQISILAGNVALYNLLAIDPGVGNGIGGSVGQDTEVVGCNLIILHVGRQEVDHRLAGVIAQ